MPGTFIDVQVDATAGADPKLAKTLEDVCPVDIFRAGDAGVECGRGQIQHEDLLADRRLRDFDGGGHAISFFACGPSKVR